MASAKAFLSALILVVSVGNARGQDIPASSAEPWHSKRETEFTQKLERVPEKPYAIDANHAYSLAELIDLAQNHNPNTRVAWQIAKARAESLGIAKSALLPTISALVLTRTWRQNTLYADGFYRDTVGLFQPALGLSYLVLDFGGRSGAIDAARAEMFAADFAFNDVHRKVVYQTAASYYRLLGAMGQLEAARATLLNAQTVEKDTRSRLDHGLATLPDVLEAQAASAQADYDLQAAIGALETAHGDLATTLGLAPATPFQVQGIDELPIPETLPDSVDDALNHALAHRPDLLQQAAELRSSEASIQQARANYFPSVSFSGLGGMQRDNGYRDRNPAQYAGRESWAAELDLRWTLFDGKRREHEVAEAKAQRAETQAQIGSLRDEISDEVWRAYSEANTALRQRRAATALLVSADKAYVAALKSYDLGLRSVLDVVAAQRTLAQARSADVFARTQVLTQLANLAFRSANALQTPSKEKP